MPRLLLLLALTGAGCAATGAKAAWPYPAAATAPGEEGARGGALDEPTPGSVEIRGEDGFGTAGAPRLRWPVPPRAVNSYFGDRPDPLDGRRRFHGGVDLEAPYGTVVLAAAAGRVVHAGWAAGHGRQVVVDHGHGLRTVYSHLSQLLVEDGTRVRGGEALGTVGNSGRSTGPHLHFEVTQDGEGLDPLAVLPDAASAGAVASPP
jgi:murein DD-endopeptidase MepM/ murein hydrolase activator NlpD